MIGALCVDPVGLVPTVLEHDDPLQGRERKNWEAYYELFAHSYSPLPPSTLPLTVEIRVYLTNITSN
jgi:hypothetical protein